MTAEIISVGTELLLGNILNTNAQYLSRELAALGITVRRQSTIGDNQDRLADFVNEAKQRCDLLENPNPTAAIYCKTGECEIRITARAQNDAEAQTMCRAYAKKFYDLLGDAVYDEDVAGLEETVVHTLQANGLTIATAESCTGGMIAQRLTSVSGASEVFGYGFVTYWEQAKAKLVGVDPAVIAQYNVVSAPVAAQMALGAAKAAGADIAVSVTGLAGPGGGDAVRPVGTVYLGAARGDKAYVKKLFVSRPDRALIRARAAQTALELALRLAQGKTPAGTQVLAESAQHDPAALTALDETLRAE